MSELRRLAREYLAYAGKVLEETMENPVSHSLSMVRFASWLVQLGEEGVERELRRLAQSFGGCISCRHSEPLPHHITLLARGCKLGLAQDTCGRWEPLLEEG
ncbi:MAG: hypothetical protein QXJ59_04390 [Thermofilaceae archaeon]